MQFRVRALNGRQQIQVLIVEALDESDAHQQLASRLLTPLSVGASRRLTMRRTTFSLLLFAQELHALVQAGLSVIEALEALAEKSPSADHRAVLSRLSASLRDGMRLSAALRQQPQFFPPLFVGIVQAAEGTSDLPRSLGRYIEYETRLDAVRHKVISATIYPALLLIVGGAVSLFLLGYVVPRFSAVYQGNGRPLPWASQMLLSWGAFAGQYAPALLIGFFGLIAVIARWVRKLLRAGGVAGILRWFPPGRARLRHFELSRLYLTLGMLLEGGIAVPQALALATAVLSAQNKSALESVRRRIEEGESFSEALAAFGLSTPVAHRLLRVGEQSGQLGSMLTRAALFYEGETTRWIERFTKTFEPVLMAAIGIVVGLIVILLYMPIFDLAGSIQ
jgi:general secretion pathway protein F